VYLWSMDDHGHPARIGAPLRNSNSEATDVVVRYSHDGRTLAIGDNLGRISLWDVTDRDRPYRVGGLVVQDNTSVSGVEFNPTGTVLAANSSGGRLAFWNLSDLAGVRLNLIEIACAKAGDLTMTQWRTYVGGLPYKGNCGSRVSPVIQPPVIHS